MNQVRIGDKAKLECLTTSTQNFHTQQKYLLIFHVAVETGSAPWKKRRSFGKLLREGVAAGRALASLSVCLVTALNNNDRHLHQLHRRLPILQSLRQIEDLRKDENQWLGRGGGGGWPGPASRTSVCQTCVCRNLCQSGNKMRTLNEIKTVSTSKTR